jgi:chorismate mutase/prephenate dehydratase
MTKKSETPSLESLRGDIDATDAEIAALLGRRAALAVEIGRLKRERGLPVYAPEREAAIHERIARLAPAPLEGERLKPVWREIIAVCRALEEPLKVAYMGPPGTFSHQAALQRFGAACDYQPQAGIDDVFHAVERGVAAAGVVPIENSTEGPVTATHDCLLESPLMIGGELVLSVHQHLAAAAETTLADVRIVLSHAQALAQCRRWLTGHLSGVPVREVASTSLAAERASREKGAAAIAGEASVRLHGLAVLAESIEDRPDNATRFLVIGAANPPPTGADRTSVVFQVRNESGSLYRALMHFKLHDVNLTRIESRPARNPWEYSFFVDMEGHRDDPRLAATLEEVAKNTSGFRWLGSYPAWKA